MAVAAFFHNEYRAQNWDPQQTRDYVERTIRFGGTFYENGLLNKGPLEPMVYRLAAAVTSFDGFWYAISFVVLLVSGLLAWAASATTRAVGGHPMLGRAIGVGVFFHFALGKADYAGVLYSRNMVVGLLAGAWLIALSSQAWQGVRARRSALAIGVLLGLSIQTLFVSTIAAFAVGLVAWFAINSIEDESTYRRCRRTLVITPVLVAIAAPGYYLVRGRIDEFWSGWWTYAKFQNTGTGRSLGNQLVYGRDVILRYYRSWPVSLVIVVAFVALTIALWKVLDRRERSLHLGIALWFLGAWTELVMSQRYSSHYFSILALPTALMAAIVVGHVYRLVSNYRGDFGSLVALPLVAGLLAIAAGGGSHLDLGLQAASGFSGVHQTALARRAAEPGKQRTVRATLDLVSQNDDPLLAWTEYPWTYLNYRRVAATRFIWKSFMLGQIYLGRTGPQYVLPKTWQWFADDMREANPSAFLEETALPMTPGTPFAAYVESHFTKAYSGTDFNIYLRNDQAVNVLGGGQSTEFEPALALGPASAWSTSSGFAQLAPGDHPVAGDVLSLSLNLCTRISGSFVTMPDEGGTFLSFLFDSTRKPVERVRLNITDSQMFSGNDSTIFDSASTKVADPQTAPVPSSSEPASHQFAIVVGRYSAALVVDGMIVAAVRLTDHDRLSLEVRNGGVELSGLSVGDPPPDSGCPTR